MAGLVIAAMLIFRAWLVSPLWFLVLGIAGGQVLPDVGPIPAVDTITPVPLPEIPFGAPAVMEMPKELKIENRGGKIEGDVKTGVHLGGPVKVEGDNGLEMFSDTAVLDLTAKSVTLNGNVSVYQGNMLQRGDRAVYFYERKYLDTCGLRASVDPILLESGKFSAEDRHGKQVFIGHNARITTHDVEDPNYWVFAKQTTIYPGDKVVFNDLKLYAGGTPVFWLPYLSQPLNGELGYHFVPGAKSNWGAFLLNTYGVMLGGEPDPTTGEKQNQWLLSRWHLDLRTERGLAAGVDLVDTRMEDRNELSGFSAYYLYDLDPQNSRTGIPRGPVDDNRYKIELKHRIIPNLTTDADWRIDSNLTWLSDEYYLEDFDMERYRIDPQPDNTLGIYRRKDDSLLSLYMRYRVNDFYRTDTRMPELTYDQARSPLFGSRVLHEGSTSLAFIGEEARDFSNDSIVNPLMGLSAGDPAAQKLLDQLDGYELQLAKNLLAAPIGSTEREKIRTQLLDSSYARFHTFQEISLPMMLGGFLSLTPQMGVGYTGYGAVDGPMDGFGRGALHVGMETSVKFSKDLGNYQNPFWGINGLMHVAQPYATWSMVSTDDSVPGDPAVDRLTPTTRPRPLNPLRFPAIDQMNNWNVIRLGTRNRLLTKRDGQSFEWLYLDSYIDGFIEDPEGDRNFSNFYNDLRWHPLPWMSVDVETQVPISNSDEGFSEYSTRMRFMPTDRFEFSLGYRWLNNHPVVTDSNRFELRSYFRVSENWGIGSRHVLEMEDGTLELQQYTLNRDLGNWVLGIGLSSRDNRYENEYGAVVSFTLKDFPSATLPFQLDAQ